MVHLSKVVLSVHLLKMVVKTHTTILLQFRVFHHNIPHIIQWEITQYPGVAMVATHMTHEHSWGPCLLSITMTTNYRSM